jgi:integrase
MREFPTLGRQTFRGRVADLGAASQALGHSDLSTTAAIYGHYDLSDLERAMEALAKARQAEEEEPAD